MSEKGLDDILKDLDDGSYYMDFDVKLDIKTTVEINEKEEKYNSKSK